jgi:hypothetical protein
MTESFIVFQNSMYFYPIILILVTLSILVFVPYKPKTTYTPSAETQASPFHSYKVFCMGKTGADCIAGALETMLPLEVGHIHLIQGRRWICTRLSLNAYNKPLADFKPYINPS